MNIFCFCKGRNWFKGQIRSSRVLDLSCVFYFNSFHLIQFRI